jgi:RsiW-degrading membrane proteinase PrsW (M82 family)
MSDQILNLNYTRAALIGAALAVLSVIGLEMLPTPLNRDAATHLLTLIAALYVGFALAGGYTRAIIIQSIGASGFIAMALAGQWLSPWFLLAGLVLHGFWDIVFDRRASAGVKPIWYAAFCASYDWILAGWVALRLL